MKKLILAIYILSLSGVAVAQIPLSGLVAYYPFCGDATDKGPNGYNMTVSTATPCDDRLGNPNEAYAFNGVNSMIYYPTLMPTTSDFTYSCWMLTNAITNTSIIYNGNSNLNGYGIILGDGYSTAAGDKITILFGNVGYYGNSSISLHTWHHLVMRKTGSIFELYIDNALAATSTGVFLPPVGEFHLGLDYTDGTNPLDGALDEVTVYDRALSAAEITMLYTNHYNCIQMEAFMAAGVKEQINEVLIKLAPNPAVNNITISLPQTISTAKVSLLNVLGRVVAEQTTVNDAANFDLSQMTSGMYIAQIEYNGKIVTKKFLKN